MEKIIDPWGKELPKDYIKMVKDFGLEEFNVKLFPSANYLMKRGIIFAGRDLKRISNCIKNKKPFYVLTGIMPSSQKIHFGTKHVIESVKYFQEKGAETYVLVADLEAAATRGISLEEARKIALKFHIPAYIALGLDPKKTKFYFQSENKEVTNLGYVFSKKITLNEFRSIYGSADPSRIMSAVMQCGDMVYPQIKKRIPGIIPVGPDQIPHINLCRDVISRFKDKKLIPISSVYFKFTQSLNGKLKMSKSHPESCLELPMDIKEACKKIKRALSGGRETLEEHRKKGADIEKDMTFELLKFHLCTNDRELNKIYKDYKSGKMTTGEIKKIACEKMTDFLKDFNKKLIKARKQVKSLKFIK